MSKKLTSITSVHLQTQPHRTEHKSEWEYLKAAMSSSMTCRILWSSVTTLKNILSNKKKILGHLYVFGIKTTWLKYTNTLI